MSWPEEQEVIDFYLNHPQKWAYEWDRLSPSDKWHWTLEYRSDRAERGGVKETLEEAYLRGFNDGLNTAAIQLCQDVLKAIDDVARAGGCPDYLLIHRRRRAAEALEDET